MQPSRPSGACFLAGCGSARPSGNRRQSAAERCGSATQRRDDGGKASVPGHSLGSRGSFGRAGRRTTCEANGFRHCFPPREGGQERGRRDCSRRAAHFQPPPCGLSAVRASRSCRSRGESPALSLGPSRGWHGIRWLPSSAAVRRRPARRARGSSGPVERARSSLPPDSPGCPMLSVRLH